MSDKKKTIDKKIENLKYKKIVQKQKMKERGITLIALVVTIIILLILAGVTLNLALGEGGIFARAKNTVDRYQSAQANEVDQLAQLEEMLNNYGQGGTDSSEVAGNLDQYQRKYVDIGLEINDNDNTADDWELFYATEDRIFLIAADYVPTSKLEAWNVIGTSGTLNSNGFKKYDSNYNVNWGKPTTFLKDGLADLTLVKHTTYDLKSNSGNPNSIAVSHLLNTTAWNGIKEAAGKKTSIDFVIGGPTLEMWCAAWNEAVKNDDTFKQIQADQTNAVGYYVGCEATSETKEIYLYMNGKKSELGSNLTTLGEKYKTFFPRVATEQGCSGYWLASPSAVDTNSLMVVYCNGRVDGYDSFGEDNNGVRPLVSLASGVQIVETEEGSGKYYITE